MRSPLILLALGLSALWLLAADPAGRGMAPTEVGPGGEPVATGPAPAGLASRGAPSSGRQVAARSGASAGPGPASVRLVAGSPDGAPRGAAALRSGLAARFRTDSRAIAAGVGREADAPLGGPGSLLPRAPSPKPTPLRSASLGPIQRLLP